MLESLRVLLLVAIALFVAYKMISARADSGIAGAHSVAARSIDFPARAAA